MEFTKINEFSDEELLDELMERYDHVMFSAIKEVGENFNENPGLYNFHGSYINLHKMVTHMRLVIVEDEQFDEYGDEDWDDDDE